MSFPKSDYCHLDIYLKCKAMCGGLFIVAILSVIYKHTAVLNGYSWSHREEPWCSVIVRGNISQSKTDPGHGAK